MSALIISLILQYSDQYNIDPVLVAAVIQNESSFNTKAVGPVGEVGLMQLRPEYFPQYSKQQLFNPKVNIRLGVEHLSRIKMSCKHQDKNTWIVCYNTGIAGGNKIKHPELFPYYKKVMGIMKQTNPRQTYLTYVSSNTLGHN